MLKLSARIVDYLPSRRATEVRDYLRCLGFEVELDANATQIGNACGIVAAWVAVDLKLAHLDQPCSWASADSAQRFDAQLYRTCNPGIGLDANDSTRFTSASQVIGAKHQLWEYAMVSRGQANTDVMNWFNIPETFDFTLRQITTDLHNVVAGTSDSIDLRVRVSNTDDCRSKGTHWFTVAYAIQRVDDGASGWEAVAWQAVRDTLASEVIDRTAQEVICEDEAAREFFGAPGGVDSSKKPACGDGADSSKKPVAGDDVMRRTDRIQILAGVGMMMMMTRAGGGGMKTRQKPMTQPQCGVLHATTPT